MIETQIQSCGMIRFAEKKNEENSLWLERIRSKWNIINSQTISRESTQPKIL